jgi:rubrerythrin
LIFYNKVDINIERDKSEIYSYLSNIENSIAKEFPNLIKEWNYVKNGNLKPEMFSVGSAEKVWWICSKCKHEWKSAINGRTPPRSSGCPKCAIDKSGETFHKNYIKKNGSLIDVNPKLAEDWHPTKNTISINDITESSPKKVWWLCKKCGHEWFTSPNNRNRGIGCPCCYGRVPKQGLNDLETLFPELSKEWNYEKNKDLTPNMVKPGSGKSIWWQCNHCKYEWQAIVRERVRGYKKCPNCKNSQDQ